MAGYSLRFSYRPRERIPVLSSTNVFQAHSEMLPRRCTEAQGFSELSENLQCAVLKHNQARCFEYCKRKNLYFMPEESVPKAQAQQA